MQRFARKVIEEHAPSVRADFDRALASELGAVYDALDAAIAAEMAEDAHLFDWPVADQKQKAFALAAFRKVINDILGAVENLRTGYFDLCQGALRSALEGFATAILVDSETAVYEAYREGKFSVNKALARFARRKDMIESEAGKQFLRAYERMHKMTHPTVVAVAVQFPPQDGGFPIGGAFYQERLPVYRAVVDEMRALAQNVAGYLKIRHSTGRPQAPAAPAAAVGS